MNASPIVFDIETCGIDNAEEFLEPVEADKRLKDPEKIAADIEAKTQARLDKLALDCNTARIVCLGYWTEEEGLSVDACRREEDERVVLRHFWRESRHRTLVGYACKQFDLRVMVRRSQLLGIEYPILNFSKYDRKGVTDLFLDLTFGDGTYDQGAMRRTLKAFCKRFGIPVDDDISGKEIPALVAAGEWDQVIAHCKSDVELTVALAQRLKVVREYIPIAS